MSRLFGLFTHASMPVSPLLRLAGDRVSVSAIENRDGYGLGYAQGGEMLLQRRPQLRGQAIDLAKVAADIRSTAFLCHVRQAEVGGQKFENTQPFRFGSWIFAQTGTLPGGTALYDSIREQLPDSIARSIAGETDAELFFHLFLSRLHDEGVSPRHWAVDLPLVARALGHTVTAWRALGRVSQARSDAPIELALLLTNGQSFFAFTHGRPLWWAAVRSTPRDFVDLELSLESPSGEAVVGVPGAVVVIDGDEAPAGGFFRPLPPHTMLCVDRDLRVTWGPAAL
ncbi:MAG: hypothetical protein EXR76_13695 [Myxococcales bacterium]|nr:hypothetical protein [Myxococcales bacterium]